MRLITARVIKASQTRHGAQRLTVEYLDTTGESVQAKALRYEDLASECKVDDLVLINVTAIDLKLGTGGISPVIANISAIRQVADDPQGGSVVFDDPAPGGGHIMKLRYTPLQHEVLSVEEPDSPFHNILNETNSLKGTPVICCELHSQVPLIAAAIKHVTPEAKIVYCMTDEAALLASFSDLLVQMREKGLLSASITCGQAFGGDFEAVNLYSGMLAAMAVCQADFIIVAQGPGMVGTATRFGHGGLAQAEALNAAAILDGIPIATLRISFADARERHQGVSHHTITALSRACLINAYVPLPAHLDEEQRDLIKYQIEESGISKRHTLVSPEYDEAGIDLMGLKVKTMGRVQEDDPVFFSAAFASGIYAARLLEERG
jgi:hypothetical protein